jgi:hypothetical protein
MLLGDDVVADRQAEPGAFAGVNSFERTSGGIPMPLSRTLISTWSPRSRVDTRNEG